MKLNKTNTGYSSEMYEINMETKGVRLVLKTKSTEIESLWVSETYLMFCLKESKLLFIREIKSKQIDQFEFPDQIRDISFDDTENILVSTITHNVNLNHSF
ncbi:hypothetical protein RF11_10551 [Thelohanellus kitauei]|uniref:Uncharacterized protein n=1 Tax=Thelohanellus kitauei TaxID=669202 RepID=A0A0C2IBY2_THEKT|nr:hypothetical protein RF11_10551 [Thelohanellus kitauei]